MLTLSSLVLATFFSAALPARAGSFVFASGPSTYTASSTPDNVQQPFGGSNRYFFGTCTKSASTGYGATAHADITVTITLTGTWTHGTGQTDATDPPPPTVWLYETGSASWSGVSPTSTPPSGGCANQLAGGNTETASTNPVGGTRSGHQFTKVTVSGGVVTLTRTFSGNASAVSSYGGQATATAGMTGYQVTVHAQPYNFHQTSVTDNRDGTLTFTYEWLSTDGYLSDLDPNCVVHEYVTYNGGNPYYPLAPFTVPAQGISNPTITPTPKQPGSAGYIMDNQLFRGTSPLNVAQPYQLAFFSATQTWEFDDSATGETNQPIPGPDSGPLSINRNIGPRPPYIPYWWYSVTKNGTTAWTPLPNQ